MPIDLLEFVKLAILSAIMDIFGYLSHTLHSTIFCWRCPVIRYRLQVRSQQHFQSSLSLKNAHSLSVIQRSGASSASTVPCVSTNLDAFGDWIEVE